MNLIKLIRYRFFLFAGIFPFLLGHAIAFNTNRFLNWNYFWIGFLGIFLVLVGVELFNEYFDAKEGTDRIFSQESSKIPDYFFVLGIFVFIIAFLICLYLTFKIGLVIFLFSFLGFLSAAFYVGPPIRWAYIGLGEIIIALSYGPFMVLGSFYLQTKRIDTLPFIVSLILGLMIFSLAIVNEIPDYFQDKLVGKKNIVVRLGKKKAIFIYQITLIFCFVVLAVGLILGIFKPIFVFIFLTFPFAYQSIRIARKYYDCPKDFIPAIQKTVFLYTIITVFLIIYFSIINGICNV